MIGVLPSIFTFDGEVLTFDGKTVIFGFGVTPVVGDEFFFPHECVIYRSAGVDSSTGDETFTGLYTGSCAYDNNASGSTTFRGMSYQASPTVLIPSTDILIAINDKVVCSTENGRTIEGTVLNFETQTESGIEGTTLWLKGAKDD